MSNKIVCEKCGKESLIEDYDFLKCKNCGTLAALIGSPYWADWALSKKPVSPTVFAKAFWANGKRSEKRLALEIDKHFEPRPVLSPAPATPEVVQARADIAALPDGITSDEGKRAYTKAEVQELLAQERERVLKALRNVVSGYGYRWDKKAINGLVSKVEIESNKVKHA